MYQTAKLPPISLVLGHVRLVIKLLINFDFLLCPVLRRIL